MTSLTTLSVLASDLGRGSTVKHRVFFFASFVSPCYFAGQQWRDDQIVMYTVQVFKKQDPGKRNNKNQWSFREPLKNWVILHHLRYSLRFVLLHAIHKCPWLHAIRKKTDFSAFRRGFTIPVVVFSDLFNMFYCVSFQFEEHWRTYLFSTGKGKPLQISPAGGTTSFEPWGFHGAKLCEW